MHHHPKSFELKNTNNGKAEKKKTRHIGKMAHLLSVALIKPLYSRAA